MPRKTVGPARLRIPSLTLHRASGQAVARFNGADVYFGRFGSKESKQRYKAAVAEYLAGGMRPRSRAHSTLTVADISARWVEHLERQRCRPIDDRVRLALKALVKLFGEIPAADFGPKRLKLLQHELVRESLSLSTLNQRIAYIKRMFRFAASEELVLGGVAHALDAVAGLRRGEFGVRGRTKVRPVAWEHVEPVIDRVSPQIAAMLQLSWWTSMRSGEVCAMRPQDIDRTDPERWWYVPSQHKTEHHGRDRKVPIGPRAQAVLRPFLDRVPALAPDAWVFSPREAVRHQHRVRRIARKTRRWPSHERAQARKRKERPKRVPRDCYESEVLYHAVTRAIGAINADRAWPAMVDAFDGVLQPSDRRGVDAALRRLRADGEDVILTEVAESVASTLAPMLDREPESLVDVIRDALTSVALLPAWHPHQLRHACATRIRARHGMDAARAVLGHASATVTGMYAELDFEAAARAMMELG